MSGPILIALSAIFDGNTINYLYSANLSSWLIVGYLGIIMQPITYGCWYYVLKRNPVHKDMPIVTCGLPLTGFIAAILLLGEKPTTELIAGGIIILFGVGMIKHWINVQRILGGTETGLRSVFKKHSS